MHVQVRHRLAHDVVHRDERALRTEPSHRRGGQPSRRVGEAGAETRGQVEQGVDVEPRDEQDVALEDRAPVEERDEIGLVEDEVSRDRARSDRTERAVHVAQGATALGLLGQGFGVLVGLFGFGGLLGGGPVRVDGSTSVAVDVGLGAEDVVVVGCPVSVAPRAVDGTVTTVVRLDTLVVVDEVGGVVGLPSMPPVRQSPTAGCVDSAEELVGIEPDESCCSRQPFSPGHHTTTATMRATTETGRATATVRRRLAARALALISARRMTQQGRRNGQVVRSPSSPIAWLRTSTYGGSA